MRRGGDGSSYTVTFDFNATKGPLSARRSNAPSAHVARYAQTIFGSGNQRYVRYVTGAIR